jgi:hypothetical protein
VEANRLLEGCGVGVDDDLVGSANAADGRAAERADNAPEDAAEVETPEVRGVVMMVEFIDGREADTGRAGVLLVTVGVRVTDEFSDLRGVDVDCSGERIELVERVAEVLRCVDTLRVLLTERAVLGLR